MENQYIDIKDSKIKRMDQGYQKKVQIRGDEFDDTLLRRGRELS